MEVLVLPPLGDGIQEAVVACWYLKEGDSVSIDDTVLEVVTDKASFVVGADRCGVIKKICVQAGCKASVGAALAEIET